MKHHVIRSLASCALAACFGSGPAPTTATNAQIVFAPPLPSSDERCNGGSLYIGDVAIVNGMGFAATLPYVPNNCNGNGSSPTGMASIYSFPLDGSSPDGMMAASLGQLQTNGGNGLPRVGVGPMGPVWLYSSGNGNGNGGNLSFGPNGGMLNYEPSGQTGNNPISATPLAIGTASNSSLFIAGSQSGGTSDPNAPQYPCCGNQGAQAQNVFEAPLPTMSTSVMTMNNLTTFGAEMKAPFVADPSGHIYYAASPSSGVQISEVTAGGMSATQTPGPGIIVVGLAATDQEVVWSVAVNATASQGLQPGCWIYSSTTGSLAQTNMIFQSGRLSCMDVAIDGPAAYFAIVDTEPQPNCDSCQPTMHGLGIGRVGISGPLTDGTPFDSIALDLGDTTPGPRRVFADNGSIYAIDPFAVVKISEGELNNAHDIAQ